VNQYDPLFAAAEQKYGLPPNILKATAAVETHFNPNAVSPTGVKGLMQINGANAKHYGMDRTDPAQAIDMAGRLWQENLKATNGDVDAAAVRYNGGGDPHYTAKLTSFLQSQHSQAAPAQQASSDPYEQALAGTTGSGAHSNDPFEAALEGGNGATHGNLPDGSAGNRSGQASNNAAGNDYSGGVDPAGNPRPSAQAVDGGTSTGGSGGTQAGPQQDNGLQRPVEDPYIRSLTDDSSERPLNALSDVAVGFGRGIDSMAGTLGKLGAMGTDAIGLTTGAAAGMDKANSQAQDLFRGLQTTPEGWANTVGEMGGLIKGTGRLLGKGLLKIGEDTPALIRLLKYGAQGSVVGLAGSDGKDMTNAAAMGAALGPVGFVGEGLGYAASKIAKSGVGQKLIEALMNGGEKAAPVTQADAEAAFDARPDSMFRKTSQMEDAASAADPNFGKVDPATGAIDMGAIVGGREATAPPSPTELAAGLKNGGAGRGIESVKELPQSVTDDIASAQANGVHPDHAHREAVVRYVGAEPTIGSTTRDPVAQRLEKVHANLDTPEGAALAERAASNNAALHSKTLETLDGYGGASTQGEAALTSAKALADASDAAKGHVTKLYKAARAADGETRLNTDGLREVLQSPELATPTNPQVKQLADGIRSHLEAVDKRTGTTLRSPDDLEQIRQLANGAYDPMGGKVNGAIRSVGKALDDSLDQLDNVSGSYKAARAAHRQWAQQFDNPEGVSQFIRRDAGGSFVNADKGQLADNRLLQGANEKPFMQVVEQLKSGGHTDALDRIKAEVTQRLHDGATRTAGDLNNNSVFSPSGFSRAFKSIGMNRMKALFSTEEIAHFGAIYKAAQALHEAVPGVVNGSNTATTLINAAGLEDAAAAAKKAASGSNEGKGGLAAKMLRAGHIPASSLHIIPGAGPLAHVAIEGLAGAVGKRAAGKATSAAGQDYANALRLHLDPAAARAAANENTARAVTKAQRKLLAQQLGRVAAPAAASQGSR
jgi:hypothetical protein